MPNEFAKTLKKWRGTRSQKEAAALLDIDYSYYRQYECGLHLPGKLARIEIERRMASGINLAREALSHN